MARSLDQVIASLPAKRRAKVEQRADELATLKHLREAVERTQDDLAARLGVGQDTVSRIERRSDILLSTLRRYVEAMGGELELVARFPNRAPFIIDHIAAKDPAHGKQRVPAKRSKSTARRRSSSQPTKQSGGGRAGSTHSTHREKTRRATKQRPLQALARSAGNAVSASPSNRP